MEEHGYKTKQKELVLGYLKSLEGQHITAAELSRRMQDDEESVSTTTVYRCLNRLVEDGKVRKFVIDSGKSACFQLVDEIASGNHYHLRCRKCGKLTHLECGEITKLQKHIFSEHGFILDAEDTVFSGVCRECQNS